VLRLDRTKLREMQAWRSMGKATISRDVHPVFIVLETDIFLEFQACF